MPDKSTPLNAASPLREDLQISLLVVQIGDIIRAYPEALRAELFSRSVAALLRASDAPCLALVLSAEGAEREELVHALPEGHA